MRKHKIKFGLNIIFDKNIYKAIDFTSRNKFSSIELWPVAPQFLITNFSKREKRKIAEYAKRKSIQIQVHYPDNISFFEPNEEIWQGYFKYLQKLTDFAKDLNSFSLTIHPGESIFFTFPEGKKIPIIENYPKYFLGVFRRNLKSLCDYAKGKTFLCIENGNNFKNQIMKIVEEFLKKKGLFLTWDIASSYNKDGTIKKQELKFFLKNLKYIKNIHLSDATPIFHHEIIGKGVINFKFFFEKLKNLDVNYIIEVRPHLNALKSRANLLRILK